MADIGMEYFVLGKTISKKFTLHQTSAKFFFSSFQQLRLGENLPNYENWIETPLPMYMGK